jgi:hypothetical protein
VHVMISAQCFRSTASCKHLPSSTQNTFVQTKTSFPLQHHHHTHESQHYLLQPWVFAQQDCDVSDERDEANHAAHNIFFAVQERLAGRVEFGVVCEVVVALGKEAESSFAATRLARSTYCMHLTSSGSISTEMSRIRQTRKSTHPPPYLLITRCTIGMSLPLTLYTTISPTCVSSPLFHRNSRSPLWNAGSMDPDRTTTMGDGESEAMEMPFQSMKAVERTSAKLRIWPASCRGCMAERPSMAAVVGCACKGGGGGVVCAGARLRAALGALGGKLLGDYFFACRSGISRGGGPWRRCRTMFVSLMPDVLRFVDVARVCLVTHLRAQLRIFAVTFFETNTLVDVSRKTSIQIA